MDATRLAFALSEIVERATEQGITILHLSGTYSECGHNATLITVGAIVTDTGKALALLESIGADVVEINSRASNANGFVYEADCQPGEVPARVQLACIARTVVRS